MSIDKKDFGLLDRIIYFFLMNKLMVFLLILIMVGGGLYVIPFDLGISWLPSNPVPVDAIPDIGENQQIVFTEWMGRSPQDVEDQITYPLSVELQGIPGVKTIRSNSMFGFSSIYVIFKDDIDFYWARSRILEKIDVAGDELPEGVTPVLGPDATAVGQIFWYTLEGRDENGEIAGEWGLDELRSTQDWYVRYGLQAVEGVSEVASIGGYVKEYQVDVDPDAMRAHRIKLQQIFQAVRRSNVDVGARTIEFNGVEYVIRGIGFIQKVSDLENVVITARDDIPIYVKNVAKVKLGPALRRGALDKEGTEAVGGVVVVRHGANPMEVIERVKKKIEKINLGLPKKKLPDGRTSQVRIVPFYDRTKLIDETLSTLKHALSDEILLTVVVVLLFLMNFRISMIISLTLPLSVLLCFILMRRFHIDSNIMSLSGIAIAIGTIVDMGIVMSENIVRHYETTGKRDLETTFRASSEVGGAILTAVLTTVVSFLPVFAMEGPEGKLFKPLAYTKTFALLASVACALTLVPSMCHIFLGKWKPGSPGRKLFHSIFVLCGLFAAFSVSRLIGIGAILLFSYAYFRKRFLPGRHKEIGESILYALFAALAAFLLVASRGSASYLTAGIILYYLFYRFLKPKISPRIEKILAISVNVLAALTALYLMSKSLMPLGLEKGIFTNFIFVTGIASALITLFMFIIWSYRYLLSFMLNFKGPFLSFVLLIILFGSSIGFGFENTFLPMRKGLQAIGFSEKSIRSSEIWVRAKHMFPGLGKEFMPSLDEGSYLYMPIVMPHGSIGEAVDMVSKQDIRISQIPEVETVVGKIGRVESALDPAPIGMIESVIQYKPEYAVRDVSLFTIDAGFREKLDAGELPRDLPDLFDKNGQELLRDATVKLVEKGKEWIIERRKEKLYTIINHHNEYLIVGRRELVRQWRDHIKTPSDIWKEIVKAAEIPGSTSAPQLQPIAARLVMLQTGMRAPMGIKIYCGGTGDTKKLLQQMEDFGLQLEKYLKEVPGVEPAAVVADRVVGKAYLEININREKIARYGVNIRDVQDIIEIAIGGIPATMSVEGRERYPIRVRYMRELRDSLDDLERILVPALSGAQIPLIQLADIKYVRGPQVIKSEDGFLVSYVLFDKKKGQAEVAVVENAKKYLREKEESGELKRPPATEYKFAGNYEHQQRSEQRLKILLPLCLFLIFLLIYFHFGNLISTMIVFVAIPVTLSGGFILLWLYSQPWFMNFYVFGLPMREILHIRSYNLSVAVWVGFIAVFGIATDDGVVINTYLQQVFKKRKIGSIMDIRVATLEAGSKRIRPCLMTVATTILALMAVLMSSGRGSDVMIPMALPSVGGMLLVLITLYVVPVCYCGIQEIKWKLRVKEDDRQEES